MGFKSIAAFHLNMVQNFWRIIPTFAQLTQPIHFQNKNKQ